MQLRPAFVPTAPVKVMINLGACLDIPTGTYVKGMRGEYLLNGGLGNLTGVVGIGNNFKSTLLHYMFLTAMARMKGSFGNTYDTEVNIHETHLMMLANRIDELMGEMVFETERWVITSRIEHPGDEWYDLLRDFLLEKAKDKKFDVQTPFMNRMKTNLTIKLPTFSQVDSLSEFMTTAEMKMQDENKLGEAGGNMLSMNQGRQKNRFLMEIPGPVSYTHLTLPTICSV